MSFLNAMELRSYQRESSQHSHDYAQLVLPINGVLELEIGSHAGLVNQDTAAFIAAGEKHCFAGSHDNLFVVVDINKELALNTPFCPLNPASKKLIAFVQSYLEHEILDRETQDLIAHLLMKTLNNRNDFLFDKQVMHAKNWLDKHFTQAIDLNQLAKQCYLSVSQLQRRFKRVMGCTIAHYWRNKKMTHAQLLLSTSSASIEAIAFSLGYEHLSTFTRSFSQQYGQSPSQWRIEHRNAF